MAAWKRGGHRAECARLKAGGPGPSPAALGSKGYYCALAAQYLFRRARAPDDPLVRAVESLVPAGGQRGGTAAAGAAVRRMAGDKAAADLSDEQLGWLAAVCENNCHNVLQPDSVADKVGMGLYAELSLINHGCRPTCTLRFAGRRLELVAARDVDAGHALTMNYHFGYAPRAARRAELLARHGFACACEACEADDPAVDGVRCASCDGGAVPLRLGRPDGPCASCGARLPKERADRAAVELARASAVEQADPAAAYQVYARWLHRDAARLNMTMNAYSATLLGRDPREAARLFRASLEAMERFLGRLHTPVACRYVILAQIYASAGQKREARWALDRGIPAVAAAVGTGCSHYLDAVALRRSL